MYDNLKDIVTGSGILAISNISSLKNKMFEICTNHQK